MYKKVHRLKLDLTQEELATATGIPRARIAKWELGKGNPKAEDSLILSKFFKKNGIDIYADDDDDIFIATKPAQILVQGRKNKGFSQIELAKKINVPLAKYQRMEAGDFTRYSPEVIQHLDKLLGIHLFEIIFDKNNDWTHRSSHLLWDDFMNVPYLPAYMQTRYIREYAMSGREIDSRLDTTLVPKELEKSNYWVIEIDDDAMNDDSSKAICRGDKLFVQEIEKMHWETMRPTNATDCFILLTTQGIICTHITQYDKTKAGFHCQYRNTLYRHHNFFPKKDVYRLFYVKKIIERKIGV